MNKTRFSLDVEDVNDTEPQLDKVDKKDNICIEDNFESKFKVNIFPKRQSINIMNLRSNIKD